MVLFEFKFACDTLAGQHDAKPPLCGEKKKKRSTYFSRSRAQLHHLTLSAGNSRAGQPTLHPANLSLSFSFFLSFIAALLVSLHLPLSIVKPTLSKDKLSRKQKLFF